MIVYCDVNLRLFLEVIRLVNIASCPQLMSSPYILTSCQRL